MSYDNQFLSYVNDFNNNYCASIGLPKEYAFSKGILIKPLPPVEITRNNVFIVGAYPSAVFKGKIPVDNLKKPFDDNKEVSNKSALELEENYLKPLGITRSQCWITNLVKVFLLKKGHLDNDFTENSERENYDIYAEKSLSWLYKEIEIANPKIIITLGNEVAGILRSVKGTDKRNTLLNYKIENIEIKNKTYKIIHMAHPGIIMRNNDKWVKIHYEGIKNLKEPIQYVLNDSK